MTLTQLYYFLKTAETLNFHKAAEELMISQPSLSAAIQHLEAELGVKLFLRKGRKISLTRRGEYFKNEVSRSLSRLHLATQEIQNAGVLGPGFIDLGYIASLAWRYIPEKVNAFLQETGYERLRFSFYELGSRELIEGLKTYRHDIIFCNQEEKDETIEFIPAVVQPLVAIVPEDHPLAKKDSINIRELAPYPLITYLPQVTLYKRIRQYIHESGWEPQEYCSATNEVNIAGLVAHHFGVAIVAESHVLEFFKLKRLSLYGPKQQRYSRTIYMAFNQKEALSPIAQEFVDFIKKGTGPSI